ncbi:carbonic anhydrase [Candidatus Micrarchaeota archaeon CG10_big_fil_rev_8_21_14_0_10_45_29]|nr:MAG: carbonic anhydrase [Candidatus Micrarchaeota archaeon CG10_big_fil_rev_8_21_14_0_10_45_29]
MNSDESLKKLKEGNGRFVKNSPSKKDYTARRMELISGQHPFVTVLACADSRIIANYIFDANLGEIFTVKNAGNLADDDITLGSLEYGAAHLHTPLLVVMGHEGCGAVGATCGCKGKSDEGHISSIVKAIAPTAEKDSYDVTKCIVDNVKETVKAIPKKSRIIKRIMDEKKLKIVGAYYSMSTGKVEFFL